MNTKHATHKETPPRIPKHLIDKRRAACNPIHMPSGVIMEKGLSDFMRIVFPGGKFDYVRGEGYVIRLNDITLLVGGHYNDFKHVRRWLVDQITLRIERELKSPVKLLAA